jgi:hypothetical protein
MDPPSLFCQGRGVRYPQRGREEALEGERTMTRVSDDLLMIACATALHGNRDREPAN